MNDKWSLIYRMTWWEMGSRPLCNGDPVCQKILENTDKCQQMPESDSTLYLNGLVQERHNSIANALELRLSCTNPSIYDCTSQIQISVKITNFTTYVSVLTGIFTLVFTWTHNRSLFVFLMEIPLKFIHCSVAKTHTQCHGILNPITSMNNSFPSWKWIGSIFHTE